MAADTGVASSKSDSLPPLQAQSVPVTPLRQNCTILSDGTGHAVVVDPGGDVDHLLSLLHGREVEAILLTHGHFDHVGGATALQRALSERQGRHVPILGPDEGDDFLLESAARQGASLGLEGMENVRPDRYLRHGETLNLMGHEIDVLHVPGHTPGHVVFHDRRAKRVLTGDTLFRGTVGRTDLPYGNGEELLSHIHQRLFTLPEETVVLPGHGLPSTIGEEKRYNPFFQ
ncbi:MBL fold metallo-hydrolase [Oecophyllibacter saccharovorans]|uniref:MBL fold metallo-hydrolase n=1 Tax=Oecophyllibacter saccharovorans TaxID=2558360 RepID=UPI00116D3F0C|nr:MBL fold metallo-hydrolase [Oecophyllibacter saccharovorans]